MSPAFAPLLVWAALAVAMGLVWAWQRRTGNAGWVDVAWAAGLGLTAITFAAFVEGWAPRRVLLAALAGLWSLRLTVHLARRVARGPEDGRYREIRERLGDRLQPWLFVFFQAQGFLVALLSLSYLIPMIRPETHWTLTDILGLLVWSVGVGGEAVADRQLRKWVADPANRGRTCRAGLWRYSRHPNYFFDWIHWLAWGVFAIGAPYAALAWIAPPVMLLLLLRVTGIPPVERQALRSRGEDYRRYQQETHTFFPGPSRAGGVAS